MFHEIKGLLELKNWMKSKNLSGSSISEETYNQVAKIKNMVLGSGDDALCELTKQFDQVDLPPNQLKVTEAQIKSAYKNVDEHVVSALKRAARNIKEYHLKQYPSNWDDQTENRTYGVQYTAIDAVGLYVPGGRAAYPSSVLMAAIPAVIAGCERIVMVSPPTGGQIPAIVLVAADIAGVTEIYQIGGAQAVFALAYGTKNIQQVDKIVGPGNRFVTAAKQMVYGVVDIDKPAGPSEVCIYCNDQNHTAFAAAEMWAQLEHDPDASAICIVDSTNLCYSINAHASTQLKTLKRQSILNESKANGVIVVVNNEEEAIECINYAASEHLVLLPENANKVIRPLIKHAGSIFCGPFSPVTLGDYYAGPNHVLPTARSARFASPLGVMDFMKYSSYLEYSFDQLQQSAADIDKLTNAEGFDAHNQAVKVRLTND